jgi:hypothetical protein
MKIVRTLSLFAMVLLAAFPLLAQNEQPVDPAPPKGVSVDDIIRKFVEKETQFARARANYTYRQSVKVQTLDGDTPDGEFQTIQDIDFDPQGRRVEHVVFAPQSTIQRVQMTKEDFDTIRNIMPFVMTNETAQDYQVNYVGQQKVDELDTYVFDIAPKHMERNKIYFQGRAWVDNRDLQIVMTSGKTLYDDSNKKPSERQQFPKFTTWREQIDGVYWFPTYSRADETLHFPGDRNQMANDVHIREIVKYTNYKRFGSNVKITYEGHDIEKGAGQQQPPPQPGQQPQTGQSPPPAQRPPR